MTEEQPNKKDGGGSACLLYVVIPFAVVVAAIHGIVWLFQTVFSSDDGEMANYDKHDAIEFCEESVRNRLKLPNNANFSNDRFQYDPEDDNDLEN